MTNWPWKIEDIIWMAGWIEAECYVGLMKTKTRWRKRPTKYATIECTNTDEKIIKWLKSTFGGVVAKRTRKKEWGDNVEKSKPAWRWRVTNRKAINILLAVRPYIKGSKADKIDEIIEYYRRKGWID